MAKVEREFFRADSIAWTPVLEGDLVDLGKDQVFSAGMYACRPRGMVHGPHRVHRGCTTLEFRYHRKAR